MVEKPWVWQFLWFLECNFVIRPRRVERKIRGGSEGKFSGVRYCEFSCSSVLWV